MSKLLQTCRIQNTQRPIQLLIRSITPSSLILCIGSGQAEEVSQASGFSEVVPAEERVWGKPAKRGAAWSVRRFGANVSMVAVRVSRSGHSADAIRTSGTERAKRKNILARLLICGYSRVQFIYMREKTKTTPSLPKTPKFKKNVSLEHQRYSCNKLYARWFKMSRGDWTQSGNWDHAALHLRRVYSCWRVNNAICLFSNSGI
jgi:hypothetical protein